MKKLLDYVTEFMKQSDWHDLTLIKFCLLTLGLLCEMFVPKAARKPILVMSMIGFIVTYVPLIIKFLNVMGINPTRKHIQVDRESDEEVFGV